MTNDNDPQITIPISIQNGDSFHVNVMLSDTVEKLKSHIFIERDYSCDK